jgi:hypothetical protein
MEFQLHIRRRSTDLLRRLACLVSDSEREQSAKKCCSARGIPIQGCFHPSMRK